MSEPPPRTAEPTGPAVALPPRRGRWRVALLGLIGVLALALPLSQVLRFQVEALLEDRAERARLDPLAEALAVHRGLADHDAVASRVLRGRTALEGERLERKLGVDRDLAVLQATLWAGNWPPARREAASLLSDWRTLATDIEMRRIDAPASQHGHRLLQEQVVQVMDLVLADGPAGAALRALVLAPAGAVDLAAQAAAVAALQRAVERRIARGEQAQAFTQAAMALLALATLALLAATAPRRRTPAPDGESPPRLRRSHGRRAGDRAPVRAPADIATEELQALRRSAEDEPSRG